MTYRVTAGLSVFSFHKWRQRFRWMIWPLKNTPFLCLEKFLGCFCSKLWVIIHVHCDAQLDRFCSIWLNLSREYSPVHFTIHPAASISSHAISRHQWPSSTGSHSCPCNNISSAVFDSWCNTLKLFFSSISLFSSVHLLNGVFKVFSSRVWTSFSWALTSVFQLFCDHPHHCGLSGCLASLSWPLRSFCLRITRLLIWSLLKFFLSLC